MKTGLFIIQWVLLFMLAIALPIAVYSYARGAEVTITPYGSCVVVGERTGTSIGIKCAASPEQAAEIIRGFYLRILKREADDVGLNHWIELFDGGMKLDVIERHIYDSPEATAIRAARE